MSAGPAPLDGTVPALGIAAMVLSAACWGSATVMTKGALGEVPPFTLLALQLATSVAFLWTAVMIGGRPVALDRGALRAAASGLLEPGLAYSVGVPGLALTGAASAAVIGATEPMVIVLIAWAAYGRRVAPGVMAGILAGAGGVGLIALAAPSAPGRLAGDGLVFAGVVFAALYVLAASRLVGRLEPLTLAALQQTAGLVLALALLGLVRLAGYEADGFAQQPAILLLGAASGIVQYALAFWLYLAGLRVLPVAVAAQFLALTPVFGVAGAALLLGEPIGALQWLGAAVVVASVAHVARRA